MFLNSIQVGTLVLVLKGNLQEEQLGIIKVVARRGGTQICHLLEEPETDVVGRSGARTVSPEAKLSPFLFPIDRRPHRRPSSLHRGAPLKHCSAHHCWLD